MPYQRRLFLKKTILSAMAPLASSLLNTAEGKTNNDGNGFTFLFQGDSITDGNRSRNNDWNHLMGHGYVYLISSRLWYTFPQKDLHFINRGISGNTTTDLLQRWNEDVIAIKPNVVSILIGINDVVAFVDGDSSFDATHFEINYRNLLEQTQQQLSGVQLILCQPFALPVAKLKDKWNDYQKEVSSRQQIVKKLAKENNAIYVPFQEVFNEALKKTPPDYWVWDGIHPMPAGHELMARTWLKEVSAKLKFIKL